MSEIHWPTELRKIEREFDGLPPELSPTEQRARRELEKVEEQRELEKIAGFAGSMRLTLVGALGGALYIWPYQRQCGAGLYAYMFASSVFVLGGMWVAAYAWRGRAAKVHMLSLLATLWGLVVLSAEVLPRVGYAKVDPTHPPTWACGAPASQPAAASPAAVAPLPESAAPAAAATGLPAVVTPMSESQAPAASATVESVPTGS